MRNMEGARACTRVSTLWNRTGQNGDHHRQPVARLCSCTGVQSRSTHMIRGHALWTRRNSHFGCASGSKVLGWRCQLHLPRAKPACKTACGMRTRPFRLQDAATPAVQQQLRRPRRPVRRVGRHSPPRRHHVFDCACVGPSVTVRHQHPILGHGLQKPRAVGRVPRP